MLIGDVAASAASRPLQSANGSPAAFSDAMGAAMRSEHRALLNDAMDMAPGFDVSSPVSALQALQWQTRHSASVMQYHFVLQAASNVSRSIKALTSLQG